MRSSFVMYPIRNLFVSYATTGLLFSQPRGFFCGPRPVARQKMTSLWFSTELRSRPSPVRHLPMKPNTDRAVRATDQRRAVRQRRLDRFEGPQGVIGLALSAKALAAGALNTGPSFARSTPPLSQRAEWFPGPKENGPHINRFKDPSWPSAHDFAC